MIDAVTGVMIIALSAAVVLTALDLTRRFRNTAAADAGAAKSLSYLMATTPRVVGDTNGRMDGFAYEVGVTEEKIREQTYCRITVRLTEPRTRRTYRLDGLRPCAVVTP